MRTLESADFGQALRYWRRHCGLTQQQLAHGANISARHISFIESGRSHPSPAAARRLINTLHLPPLRRNELMAFAGLTAETTDITATRTPTPDIACAMQAIMDRSEPYPAFVMDAYKNVIQANRTFEQFFNGSDFPVVRFGDGINIPLTLANTEGLYSCLNNWETLFLQMVLSIEYNTLQHPRDTKFAQLHNCLQNHQKTQAILKTCLKHSAMDGELSRLSVKLDERQIDFSVTITAIWDDGEDGRPMKFEVYSVVPVGEVSTKLANSLMQLHTELLASQTRIAMEEAEA